MKRLFLALCLFLFCGELFTISIQDIDFDADFTLNKEDLIEVSGLMLGTQYVPEAVDAAIENLKEYFIQSSQYYVQISLPELIPLADGSLKLLFTIRQLADSNKVQIRYTGLRYFSESKIHEYTYTSTDQYYALSDIPDIMNSVLQLYQQRGFLFAIVQLDSLVMGESILAYINVNEGGQQQVTDFRFRGNKVSRKTALIQASGLLRQDIISPQVLIRAEENIKKREYIRSCSIIPLDEQTLLIDVQEGRMTYLEGLLGISENAGKRELSGMINLEFLNLWGTDRGIKLFWKKNPNAYSELSLGYHESGIPGIPLAADLELSRTTQDSLWIRSLVDVDIYYITLFQRIGFSFAANSILPGTGYSPITKESESSFGAFWKYQNASGERIPTKGMELDAAYDYVLSASGNKYGKLSSSAKYYFPLRSRFISYLGIYYKDNNKQNPEAYDLYSMGGFASLRGYREDEFKSNRLAWANIELRYMIGPETMIYTFFDHGYMQGDENNAKYDLMGIGAGLKVSTRLGMMSIEYGLGYRDNSFSSLGLGMIHLGLDIAL